MHGFIEISHYVGSREDFVQARGGNSAYKIDETHMFIKASGYQLSELTEEKGYAIVNPKTIIDAFFNCDSKEFTEEFSKEVINKSFIKGEHPSIETFLHAVSGRYSLHTHPIVVNILGCRKKGKMQISNLFPKALIVEYATPGIELAKAYFEAYKKYKKSFCDEPSVVFLMNHGLLVSADTADEVIETTENIVRRIEVYLGLEDAFKSYHNSVEVKKLFDNGIVWTVNDCHVIETYKKMDKIWHTDYCPDCVVFLGKSMYKIIGDKVDEEDYQAFRKEKGDAVVIEYKGSLYIHATNVKKAMEIQSVLSFASQVATANAGEECIYLSEDEKNFLLHWDAEKYRQKK